MKVLKVVITMVLMAGVSCLIAYADLDYGEDYRWEQQGGSYYVVFTAWGTSPTAYDQIIVTDTNHPDLGTSTYDYWGGGFGYFDSGAGEGLVVAATQTMYNTAGWYEATSGTYIGVGRFGGDWAGYLTNNEPPAVPEPLTVISLAFITLGLAAKRFKK